MKNEKKREICQVPLEYAGGGTNLLYEPREGQPGFFGNFDIDTHHPPDWYPYQSGFCFQKLTPTPKRLLQTHTNFKSLRKNEHPPPKTRIKIKNNIFFVLNELEKDLPSPFAYILIDLRQMS